MHSSEDKVESKGSSEDVLVMIPSTASLHTVGVIIPIFSDHVVESAYAAHMFRKNVCMHVFLLSVWLLGDVALIFAAGSTVGSSAEKVAVSVGSDFLDTPMVVLLLVYRIWLHSRPDRYDAHRQFLVVITWLLTLFCCALSGMWILEVLYKTTEERLATLLAYQGEYFSSLLVSLSVATSMFGFLMGSIGMQQSKKFRLAIAIIIIMSVPSLGVTFWVAQGPAPIELSDAAANVANLSLSSAHAANLSSSSVAFMSNLGEASRLEAACGITTVLLTVVSARLMMTSATAILFFLLGFITSHCIDCLWREAFAKDVRARLAYRRKIELLDSEKQVLSLQRGADSRLNHIMKNKCGAAVQLLELVRHDAMQRGALSRMSSATAVPGDAAASATAASTVEALSSSSDQSTHESTQGNLDAAILSLTQAIEWLACTTPTLAPAPALTRPRAHAPACARALLSSRLPHGTCITCDGAAPPPTLHPAREWELPECQHVVQVG